MPASGPRRAAQAVARPVARYTPDYRVAVWLSALMLAAVVMFSAVAAHARSAPDTFADLAEELSPSVVNISTTQNVEVPGGQGMPFPQFPPGSPFEDLFRDFFGDRGNGPAERTRKVTALGSGFVIDAEGYVVTNNHVIKDADEITVILSDNTSLPADVIGYDNKTDLALLKVKTDQPLPSVTWGDSDDARVGDWVLAVGNPFGLGGSVTAGIISARARDINVGPFDDFLQTDAAINRGNSGGPMFNLDGEVIGVNTAIFSPTGGSVGIGFAVPSALAMPVIEQLRRYGRTRRGWLGVRIQPVTEDIAESLDLDDAAGALVAEVTPGSPAARGGIEVGDVILRFDDREVEEMRELPRIVAETDIGKSVPVEVWRGGGAKRVSITVGELEEREQAMAEEEAGSERGSVIELGSLGLRLAAITLELRETFRIPEEVEGVLVVDVEDGGPAAEKGMRPGDIIVEAGRTRVATPADVEAVVQDARDRNLKSILLLIRSGRDTLYKAVKLRDE